MKIVIDRSTLLKALSHVQSVVERRGTVPILGNVKLDATGNALELTATDMDIAMMEKVSAVIEEHGATTVPAHTFYEIIRKIQDGAQVELATSGDKMNIRAGQSRFTLSCLPVEEFPVLAEGDLEHNFTLTSTECLALIEKTRFAVSTEETRYYLNGIYLHVTDGEHGKVLRAVATDGHRLARIEVDMPDGAASIPGVIIPRKTIGELRKLIEEGVDTVKVSLSGTKIRFECGHAVLISKLIDGNFPDYERVIPTHNDKVMEVPGKFLSQCVDRVSVIASEKTRGIKLLVEDGKLTLTANSAEQGNATEELDVKYNSDSIEIGFNSRYLMEMLAQIEGDMAHIAFSDSSSPAVVRDTACAGALYVVMPMRV
jgi:DNA polymerase-3 subunit beta